MTRKIHPCEPQSAQQYAAAYSDDAEESDSPALHLEIDQTLDAPVLYGQDSHLAVIQQRFDAYPKLVEALRALLAPGMRKTTREREAAALLRALGER
jgi:hypothetical protein